jgi:hypothetical protein
MFGPTQINFLDTRFERQKMNNNMIFEAFQMKDENKIRKLCNEKELYRVLEETNLTFSELIEEVSNNSILNIVLSGRISKNASRQGTKDEELQIEACKRVANVFDIEIEKLNVCEVRPTKAGEIITDSEMKEKKILKDECLKSFDAKISGKMNGYLFAKVVFGSGGHQDNVFEEADILCCWVKKFHKDSENMFVVLLDTNLVDKFNKLKSKYHDISNILITNHYEFQQYIIENYSNK